MARPLVSIIIAAYKTPDSYLSTAIESALGQTVEDLEVIVSDDSAEPRLAHLVNTFQDARVKYRANSVPLGVALNHYQAFKEASGKYLAILNHDDKLAPTFIQELLLPLETNDSLSLAFCDHYVMDSKGDILDIATERNSDNWGRQNLSPGAHRPFDALLANQSIPMAMGTVFRTSLLPHDCPPSVGPAYDLWLTYVLCSSRLGAYFVPKRLSYWRTHTGSITSQGSRQWNFGTAYCWMLVLANSDLQKIHPIARKKLAEAYASCSIQCWKQNERWDGLRYGLQSLTTQFSRRGLIGCALAIAPKWILRFIQMD